MKLRNFLFMSISALMLFAIGCSENDESGPDPGGTDTRGVLVVKLAGDSTNMTRGVVTGGDVFDNEKKINNFIIYVFNESNNTLEQKKKVTESTLTTTTIEGLSTATSKKVVVLTNIPTGFPELNVGDPYSNLRNTSHALDLPSQNFDKIQTEKLGMVMYGEIGGVVISGTSANEVTVDINRVVAKITLSTLAISPGAAGVDPAKFKITGISVQRAVNKSSIYGEMAAGSEIAGGILTSTSTIQHPFLFDEIDLTFPTIGQSALATPHIFYVFPNNGPSVNLENCTLLTLRGQYNDGQPIYYPIPINAVVQGEQDGTFIKGNNNYVVHVILKDIANGATDPEELLERGSLDVNVNVVPWTNVNQLEEW